MKEITLGITLFTVLAVVLTHILLALGVNREASRLRKGQIPLYAFTSSTWVFIVLLTGIFGFLTFWLIHNSALRDHGLFRR